MPYDETLADRVRDLLAGESDLTERRMFGGLGFMLAGHMAVAANSHGGLMVRVDPDSDLDPLLEPMVMRGRPMGGWAVTDAGAALAAVDLARLVGLGSAYARSLPPKEER